MTTVRRSRWRAAVPALLALVLSSARGTDQFDIEPATPPRVVGADYFGTHFHRLGHAESRFPATDWPAGMVGALRLWDSNTRWADLEPQSGRFNFDRLDHHLEQAEAHGAPVLMVLGSPAQWASARPSEPGPYGPGSAAEPRDLEQWDRYVTAIARRYKGRIAHYELWNEPYFSDFAADRGKPSAFFTGSAATMVELARRTRAVLTREDPRAQLLTPGFVGATNRLDLFLSAGGGQYVDAVAYHFYAQDDREFIKLTTDVRAVMNRHGMGQRPLFNTESGFAIRGVEGQPLSVGEPRLDRRRAAALLARSMVLGAHLGMERFYQYAWDNGRMGMQLPDGRTDTDSLRAYAAVSRWLIGTTLRGCRAVETSSVVCQGTQNGNRLFVGWQAVPGVAGNLTLPLGWGAASAEHATDGSWTLDAGATSIVLPADGMPVAVWAKPRAALNEVAP